mmetsp:Transcript_30478/g.68792  ORF Transcript_30478/g.68792 Transcript_30478/m.68792 type:complete len:212 (-) Transcript_30478:813-1448(-)
MSPRLRRVEQFVRPLQPLLPDRPMVKPKVPAQQQRGHIELVRSCDANPCVLAHVQNRRLVQHHARPPRRVADVARRQLPRALVVPYARHPRVPLVSLKSVFREVAPRHVEALLPPTSNLSMGFGSFARKSRQAIHVSTSSRGAWTSTMGTSAAITRASPLCRSTLWTVAGRSGELPMAPPWAIFGRSSMICCQKPCQLRERSALSPSINQT